MSFARSTKLLALALTVSLVLAGCKSAEERAEEHYQSGIALLEQGDVDRAIVELRNVFQLNGSHKEARRLLAMTLIDQDNMRGAYGQLLRLVEQYPDDLEARILLGEIAFEQNNWEEVERHGALAQKTAPEDARVKALSLARQYRAAALEDNDPDRRKVARQAETAQADLPDNVILRNLMIDAALREGDYDKALSDIDWMLERRPDSELYWGQRLNVLVQQGNIDGLEAQLLDLITRFPENDDYKRDLIRLFLARNAPEKAEEYLRDRVAQTGEPGARVDLIRFVSEVRGRDAARAEIEIAIAEAEDKSTFQVMAAGMDFEDGNTAKAIATLETLLQGAEATEKTRAIKVTLAQMLQATGNAVGARAQVEEVLVEDATNADALKMRAAWLIEADNTDGAVASLRTALESAPEDAQAMTLMAQAYYRAGRAELARDFLALAVESSGNAPAETVRYAQVLIQEERFRPAEDILLPALRLAPLDQSLLAMTGQLYLAMDDMGRLEQVVRALREIGTEESGLAANDLEAEKINRRSGTDEALSYIENLATSENASLSSKFSLVRARIATGDIAGALELAQQIQAEEPQSDSVKALVATAQTVNGNFDAAEEIYNDLLEENPNRPGIWLEMSRLQTRKGNREGSVAAIEQGLVASPEAENLLWAKASLLEQSGDFEGAIAIYEGLYERNSSSPVIANNLASMMATYREDEESLNRAQIIARRFRDAQVPALQDTYGWIAHRTGASEEALPYLQAAAEGLPNDPVVQYHLGQVYLTLGRSEEALDQFRRAVDVAGPADTRRQMADAKAQIQALQNQTQAAPEN